MNSPSDTALPKTVLVIGGANVDEVLRLFGPLTLEASNRVSTAIIAGGIARNVAQNLAALGARAQLVSAIGDDASGDWLIAETAKSGVDTSRVLTRQGVATGRYLAALASNGDLQVGFADMAAVESICPEDIRALAPDIAKADHLFADANLDEKTLSTVLEIASETNTPVTVDLVSPHKAMRLGGNLKYINLVVGNRNEALALLACQDDPQMEPIDLAKAIVEHGASRAVISDGSGTVGWCCAGPTHNEAAGARRFGALVPLQTKVVDVTGAGDALHSGIIISLAHGNSLEAATQNGLKIAALVVGSSEHALTPDAIQ